MKNWTRAIGLPVLFLILLNITVGGSSSQPQEDCCAGPIYQIKEVSKRAKLTRVPELTYTEEARAHQVYGKVVVTAVLRRTGKVTNIEVIESLPYGLIDSHSERRYDLQRRRRPALGIDKQ